MQLVILPSPLIQERTYKDLKKTLSACFDVHVIELPASGENKSPKKWDYEMYADWALSYLRMKGPFILMGHSNSGPTAALLAKRCPGVSGLVLVGTVGLESMSYFRTIAGRALDAVLEMKRFLTPRATVHILQNLFRYPRNVLHQVKISIKGERRDIFENIRIPVLFIWGRHDHTVPFRTFQQNAGFSSQKDWEVSIIDSGSHDCLITDPEKVTEVIYSWSKTAGKITPQREPLRQSPEAV